MIEGLNALTNLKDLTLYNNRIQKIENMDSLENLHIFSVGNNNITELDNVSVPPFKSERFILFIIESSAISISHPKHYSEIINTRAVYLCVFDNWKCKIATICNAKLCTLHI